MQALQCNSEPKRHTLLHKPTVAATHQASPKMQQLLQAVVRSQTRKTPTPQYRSQKNYTRLYSHSTQHVLHPTTHGMSPTPAPTHSQPQLLLQLLSLPTVVIRLTDRLSFFTLPPLLLLLHPWLLPSSCCSCVASGCWPAASAAQGPPPGGGGMCEAGWHGRMRHHTHSIRQFRD